MTIDNRYRVHDLLGAGAMGRVYRATSRLTGREVALKLLREPDVGSDQGRRVSNRLALAREFQTLSSLHHPNVVRVLDYGFDQAEGPFFTMELLPGAQTLYAAAGALSRAGRLELLAQLARALTYLHRRGVLHRDLKPNNVLVAAGEVRLVDFGIASPARGRAPVAGTPGYMAPELWQGVPASVRSDLYAFGVLAVALLAGADAPDTFTRLGPSSGASPTLSLGLTTMTIPPDGAGEDGAPAPHVLLESVEGDLRPVLGRLLHPEPSQRYASMEEALDALNRAAGTAFPVETPETRESLLGASSLVGREAEMGELREALDRARAGAGAAILVGGESGVGKSRLVDELRTLALVHGTTVAVGQAAADAGAPYQLWLPILGELAVRAEPGDADAAVLKALVPELDRVLGRAIPDAPALPAAAAKTRLRDAVLRLLAAQPGPTAVFVEDLQWAGDDSLELLAALTDGVGERPVLVVGTWRNDEAPDLPARLPAARVMRVPRLAAPAVAELATSILGPAGADPELAAWLFRETEGNVFFLVEVVRELAVQAGQLDHIRPEALPDRVYTRGIDRVARRRYDSVPEADRALLALAAVAGRQIDPVVLGHAAGASLDAWLRRCANAAVLDGTGGDWRFAHDKYREAILGRLAGDERAALHRRVAAAMEALADVHPVQPARCAWHYAEGGDPANAWVWHMRAGEAATRRCAYGEARDQFAAAIRATDELPPDDPNRRRRVDALLRKVYTTLVADTAQLNLARMAEARALLGDIAAPTPEDRLRSARVDHATGRIHFYRGEVPQAIGYYQKVLPVAMESGDAELAALPASLIGTALLTQGRMTRAEPLLRQAIAPLERLGEPFEWFRAVGYHGASLVALGRYSEGLDELRRVQARGREIGQPSLASATWLMSGSSYLFSGDWPEVLACLARVRALAPQTGDKLHLSLAWSGTAWAQGWLGRAAEAAESRAAGRAVAAEMGGRLMLGDWFEAADAELALIAGDLDGARARAAEVAAGSGAAGLLVSQVVAERVLGVVHARVGDADAAATHFGASLAAAESGGLALPAARTRFEWALATRLVGGGPGGGPGGAPAEQLRAEARAAYERAGCTYALAELDARWAAGVAPGVVLGVSG